MGMRGPKTWESSLRAVSLFEGRWLDEDQEGHEEDCAYLQVHQQLLRRILAADLLR